MAIPSRRRVRVSRIPKDVQKRITAAHPGMSINDYVVGVLSRRYGYEWEPVGLRSRREDVGDNVLVKLPEAVWVDLKQEATPYSTMSAVIIRAIREDE